MIEVLLPSLAEGMEEGTIARWLQADGAHVKAGDEIVEIETDKVTMSSAAEADGVLRIAAPEGATVSVGAVIAHIGASQEADVASPASAADQPQQPEEASGRVAEPEELPAAPSVPLREGNVRATPVARLIARKRGLDLNTITGSGPRGLITRADLTPELDDPTATRPHTDTQHPGTPAAPSTVAPSSPPRETSEARVQELTRLQNVIAQRMTEAKATVPEFQVQTEAAMDAVIEIRERLKTIGTLGIVPSINDFVVKSAAVALRQHPLANASFQGGRFILHPRVNVGVAVAAENALVVPTITDADTRSLPDIAAETRRLAERARSGTVTPQDLANGTFTVSSLGMYGMTAITPIINTPQAAILGVGAIRETLALHEGSVVSRRVLTLTLTCDHRILYGADAARFLSTVRDLLEQPLLLLMGGNADGSQRG